MARILTIKHVEKIGPGENIFCSDYLEYHLEIFYPDGSTKCIYYENNGISKAEAVTRFINELDDNYNVRADQVGLFIKGKIDELVLMKYK